MKRYFGFIVRAILCCVLVFLTYKGIKEDQQRLENRPEPTVLHDSHRPPYTPFRGRIVPRFNFKEPDGMVIVVNDLYKESCSEQALLVFDGQTIHYWWPDDKTPNVFCHYSYQPQTENRYVVSKIYFGGSELEPKVMMDMDPRIGGGLWFLTGLTAAIFGITALRELVNALRRDLPEVRNHAPAATR